jgi:hypothetical protein
MNNIYCKNGHLLSETRKRHPNGDTYCSVCKKKRSVDWKNKNTDRIKKIYRKANYKRYYNISIEEVDFILKKQNYKCAICNDLLNISKKKAFNVDHSHTSLAVRGILCHNCNTGLGLFKDNIKNLFKAILYISLSMAGKSRKTKKK